jgi:hypothetical protein
VALAEAEYIDGICQRYSCLPSAVDAEDTYLHRMIAILDAAGSLNPGTKVEPAKAGSEADLADMMETLGG